MNAYLVDIWTGVKHNNKFSHNVQRVELVHARNENEAKTKVTLVKGYKKLVGDLALDVSNETIYSVRKIGTVRIKRCYVYSDGRSPVVID